VPKKLMDCVAKVKARRGSGKVNPWAICVASTGLKPHKKSEAKKDKK
jgi:hypothetical protein